MYLRNYIIKLKDLVNNIQIIFTLKDVAAQN